ncbi:MAG: hypothetical protein OCD01_05085 [Fibrobacterales bacterium]
MKMLKQMMVGAVLLVSVFAGNAFSNPVLSCANVEVKDLYANGTRYDIGAIDQTNTILVTPRVPCGKKPNFYIAYNNPGYSSMLTLILNAMNTGTKLVIYINDDGEGIPHATEIVSVRLMK